MSDIENKKPKRKTKTSKLSKTIEKNLDLELNKEKSLKETAQTIISKPVVERVERDTYCVYDVSNMVVVDGFFSSRSKARIIRDYYIRLNDSNKYVIARGKDHPNGMSY